MGEQLKILALPYHGVLLEVKRDILLKVETP
jgi:hypothetical protein